MTLQPVPLPKACRLLNHGPTVLVSSAHAGRRNVMAAAWSMPLDFDPLKVAVVIDKATFTRELIEGAGEFEIKLNLFKHDSNDSNILNEENHKKQPRWLSAMESYEPRYEVETTKTIW